ncbi:MAG TPA: hypothetical protein PLR25_21125 [Planctomycetaceae bacterium]|nr:hypothetical protein [Planctomycetaceae bacterium]
MDTTEQRATVRDVLKLRPVAEIKPPTWEDRGRVQRDGYHIDKLVLRTDSGQLIPGLTFHPPTPSDDAYLYLHDQGKLGDGQTDGAIVDLVNQGFAVVSIDLRGQGNTSSGHRSRFWHENSTVSPCVSRLSYPLVLFATLGRSSGHVPLTPIVKM